MAYGKKGGKPARLGIGDKPSISGDPTDMGLNMRKGQSNKEKLRGDTGEAQQPTLGTGTIKSDRGSFKCDNGLC